MKGIDHLGKIGIAPIIQSENSMKGYSIIKIKLLIKI